jgi:hypothetical protein
MFLSQSTLNTLRPKFHELVKAAREAGHVNPEWLATCLYHAAKAGQNIDDAIDEWRRATPDKFVERPKNVLRRR